MTLRGGFSAAGLALVFLITAGAPQTWAQSPSVVARGEYLVRAGECFSCHTVPGGTAFAGGRALATPFGTFYSPNITPDKKTGIGNWTDVEFVRALRKGVRPDGAELFSGVPLSELHRNFQRGRLGDQGLSVFRSRPSTSRTAGMRYRFPSHGASCRTAGKCCFSPKDRFVRTRGGDNSLNRGAYLVTALGHCGECHTPRNRLGAMRKSMWLAGTVDGPDDDPVPNITPDAKTGIGDWREDDIAELLKTGDTPLESKVKGAMKEVVADSTSHLTDADRRAIATYLEAQAPVVNSVTDEPEPEDLSWYSVYGPGS